MEFLRRLRIIWTALCVIAAVLIGLSYMGSAKMGFNTPAALPWFFAAVASAIAFHLGGSWRLKLSVLWLGGVGLFMYGALTANINVQFGDTPAKALIQTLALVGGVWVVAAALAWLLSGLLKPKNASSP